MNCLTCKFEPEWSKRSNSGWCQWKPRTPKPSAMDMRTIYLNGSGEPVLSGFGREIKIKDCPAWRAEKSENISEGDDAR